MTSPPSEERRDPIRRPIPACLIMIRDLFAATADAKARGYKKGRFSFNVKGGRCEACSGDGIIKIEMHFLPDVYVPCEVCRGKRYNRETLEVKYKGKSIYDVLNMTVEEALDFFETMSVYSDERLRRCTMWDLSYIRLGQPSTDTFRRRGPADQAGHGAEPDAAPERPFIFWMSQPPACILQMSTSWWRFCSGWQKGEIPLL